MDRSMPMKDWMMMMYHHHHSAAMHAKHMMEGDSMHRHYWYHMHQYHMQAAENFKKAMHGEMPMMGMTANAPMMQPPASHHEPEA